MCAVPVIILAVRRIGEAVIVILRAADKDLFSQLLDLTDRVDKVGLTEEQVLHLGAQLCLHRVVKVHSGVDNGDGDPRAGDVRTVGQCCTMQDVGPHIDRHRVDQLPHLFAVRRLHVRTAIPMVRKPSERHDALVAHAHGHIARRGDAGGLHDLVTQQRGV